MTSIPSGGTTTMALTASPESDMARFYGEMRGAARLTTSRIGTPKSGLSAHIRGWDIGVEVVCSVNAEGHDEINVWTTGGSRDAARRQLVMTLEYNG